MEKKKKKKKQNRKQTGNAAKNQQGMLFISILAVVLLFSFLIQGMGLRERRKYYYAQLENLEAQIEEEKERTKEIQEERDYMTTDEYIETVAREKLGLVKENEILFKELE